MQPRGSVIGHDTYISTAHPSVNFSGQSKLFVNSSSTTLIEFDLSSLPLGTTASQIGAASLKLYVNRINNATPALVNVVAVTSAWNEYTATAAIPAARLGLDRGVVHSRSGAAVHCGRRDGAG